MTLAKALGHIREVVALGAERGWSFLGRPGAGRYQERVPRALLEVNAGELGDRPFRSLSEGQKQRVLFARLVAGDAEVAILDEPLDHLGRALAVGARESRFHAPPVDREVVLQHQVG